MWALPGGFMRINETAEQCALRELREETGYVTDNLRQVHTYSAVGRDPRERVLTVAFYALVKMGAVHGGDDAVEARWFPVSQLPDLAFDHREIINDALLAMRRDVYFEPIGFELLPPTFTMSELQKIIETITGDTFDRRNFYNKMRHMQFVSEVTDEIEERISGSSRLCVPNCEEPMFVYNEPRDEDMFGPYIDSDIDGAEPRRSKPRASVPRLSVANDCDDDDNVTATRRRRSGVRYFFNALAFKKRKDSKGSGPITY